MKPTVGIKLGQRLAMTPALQQAIRMLSLSTMELQGEIQDALESNLMLEAEEQGGEAAVTTERDKAGEIPEDLPVDASWNDIYAGAGPARSPQDASAAYDYQQANLQAAPDLHEHLHWQASLQDFDAQQAEYAAHLIDAVDDAGYLRGYAELAARLGGSDTDAATLADVLTTIQAFDPPGVAARDLAECLALQLRQLDADTPGRSAALAIVEQGALQTLAGDRPERLVRRLGLAGTDDLAQATALIRSLQPHPGEAFTDTESRYIIPEVFVHRRAGRWQVSLNPEVAPRLRINTEYQRLIKRADASDDQRTLKQHLQEARFFLNSLESRNDTLLRVAQCVVEQQRAFLEYGEEAMKPLVLKDIADALEIHESTVSRATAHKYMQTPRGVFELKYFFSSHVSTSGGGACSATAIQAMIKRLVDAETPGKPLSDSKLTELLHADGIQVARRTVAKYREAQHIAPSHQRRRAAS